MRTVLDLFCKAGGCSMGYYQAGYKVVGVDRSKQISYPFDFVQADAFSLSLEWLQQFDLIHASPPCQAYSTITNTARDSGVKYPDLLARTREMLVKTGKPWVIENVIGAPVQSGIILCGSMFGLKVRRHRHFESNYMLFAPSNCKHTNDFVSVYGSNVTRSKRNPKYAGVRKGIASHIYTYYDLEVGKAAMGIDWMDKEELSQAIPPAYTKYVGEFFQEYYFS